MRIIFIKLFIFRQLNDHIKHLENCLIASIFELAVML